MKRCLFSLMTLVSVLGCGKNPTITRQDSTEPDYSDEDLFTISPLIRSRSTDNRRSPLNTAISSQDDYTTGSTTDPSIDALPDATLELAEDPEIHSKKSVNILANPEPTDTIMISNEIAVTFYLDLHRIVLDRGTAIAVIEPLGKIFSTLALLHPKNYSTITTTIGTVAFKNNNGIYKRFLDTVERGIGQSNENHWFVINHGTCPASETAAARRILDLTSSPNGSKPSLITHVSCSPDGLGSGRTLSLLLPDTPILGADTALTLTKFRTQNSFNPPLVLNKMLSTAQPKDQSWYSWENGIVKKIDETDLSKFILLDINQLTGLAIVGQTDQGANATFLKFKRPPGNPP